MEEKITISLSKDLMNKLTQKAKETGFNSVEEYISYVLNQVTSEKTGSIKKEQIYSEEEEKELKKTLGEMGYL